MLEKKALGMICHENSCYWTNSNQTKERIEYGQWNGSKLCFPTMLKRNNSKRSLLRQVNPSFAQNKAQSDVTHERFLEAKRIFAKYDKDGEGAISRDLFLLALKDFGHTDETAQDIVANFKTNEHGK